MSRTTSPVSGKPYGLAAVCRVWHLARDLSPPGPAVEHAARTSRTKGADVR